MMAVVIKKHTSHNQTNTGQSLACMECLAYNEYGYHRACYQKYTYKKMIDASIKRVQKKPESQKSQIEDNVILAVCQPRQKRMCSKDPGRDSEAFRKDFFQNGVSL